jgi:hypothetical protein
MADELMRRIEKLERSNRRMKLGAGLCLLALACGLMMGQQSGTGPANSNFAVLTAQKIIVGGNGGQSSVVIQASDKAASVSVLNGKGDARATLINADGLAAAVVLKGSSGATTELRRADEISGDGGLELTPAGMKFPTVVVTGTPSDGGLTVRTPAGRSQWTIGFSNENLVQTFPK